MLRSLIAALLLASAALATIPASGCGQEMPISCKKAGAATVSDSRKDVASGLSAAIKSSKSCGTTWITKHGVHVAGDTGTDHMSGEATFRVCSATLEGYDCSCGSA